jgi:tetratricopeptide (TPR) repeat protein
MKKIFFFVHIFLLFCVNTYSETTNKDFKLNKLFNQLKKTNNASEAFEIEMQIWQIWSTHPIKNQLTELLSKGSEIMSNGDFISAYKIFSEIVELEPNWAEGWNKRATTLYLMGKYERSLDDINVVLKLESRHFGALSGQGLVYIELNHYEKAIESYKAAQKIYPLIESSKMMIPQLEELIKKEAI